MNCEELKSRHDELVRDAVASDVPPVELCYRAVYGCSSGLPVAYRTFPVINSLVAGRLTPSEYAFAASRSETGIRLAYLSIRKALRHLHRFDRAGREPRFLAVSCPVSLLCREDLYDRVKRLLAEEKTENPSRLCLEFSQAILSETSPQVRKSVLDLKLLHVRTLMRGAAAGDCPTSRLSEIPVDAVLLAPEITALTNDRNKPQLVPSLVQYLKSMYTEVLAEGVVDDEQIRSLSRLDCAGYTPAASYCGSNPHTDALLSPEEALSQKGAETE